MSIDVFDFFSGCGGTSCGFREAGFNIKMGLDIDEQSARSFQGNFPEADFINDDIVSIHESALAPFIGNKENPMLFSGCAPCQPFSKQNRQPKSKDGRLTLLDEFSRFIEFWMPDFVFVENVPGMQRNANRSETFTRFTTMLERVGYHYSTEVVEAQWYGVPQKRTRLILLASLHAPIAIPERSHGPGQKSYSTVRDWIGSLPKISHGEMHHEDPNHFALGLSKLNYERIKATPEGSGRDSWPAHLILDCHKNYKGHTDVYGRLTWDRPAVGLTTKCISYSNGRFGHPEQDRALSLREAALLQTFPSDFHFHGTKMSQAQQVGNAVPPLMAFHVGGAFKKAMTNVSPPPPSHI